MEFCDEKFEQLNHGKIGVTAISPYKGLAKKETGNKEKVEDLNEKIVLASLVMSGVIMSTFTSGDRRLMLKIFSFYIRSEIENFCCMVTIKTS